MNETADPRPLILGSTSVYRRELLGRLQRPFSVERPDVDETPLSGEAPNALARRLALAQAHAEAALHPNAWVIGSDQDADLHGEPMLQGMRNATLLVTRDAKRFAPVDTGRLRASITPDTWPPKSPAYPATNAAS
jgi:hypothetical protein